MLNTAVTSLFGLIFWATASNRQTPIELGSASAIIALFPLAATIGGLGLDAAVFRHFALSTERRKLVSRSIILSSSCAGLVGLAIGTLRIAGTTWFEFIAVALATSALGANAVTSSSIVASRRTALLLVEGVVSSVVKISALFALPADEKGLLAASVLGIVSSAMTSICVVFLLIKPERGVQSVREKVRKYAVSNWVSSSFSLLPFSALPALMLWRSGPESAAYVTVAALVSPLLRLVPTVVTRSFFAEVAADPVRLATLVRRTYKLSLGLTACAAAVLAILAPYVLALFGSSYQIGSTTLLRFLSLATVIAVANYLSDAVLNLLHDHKAFLFTNISGMTCLMLILVVASRWGAEGIGVGWVLGESTYAIIAWTTVLCRHRDRLSN